MPRKGIPPKSLPDVVSVWTAAPASVIRSVTFRPLSGSSRIRSFWITSPTPELRASTSAAPASTTIYWVTAPTCKATSTRGLLLTVNRMPDCTYVVKPSLLTSTRYDPMGRLVST